MRRSGIPLRYIGPLEYKATAHHALTTWVCQKWGVDCTRFEIQTFKPHNREVEKQLELQMQAERERRKQLLDTQALVNVAEGQKERTILESEGGMFSYLPPRKIWFLSAQ